MPGLQYEQQHGQLKPHQQRYERSDDNLARLIVYFGPYVLWGAMGVLLGGLFLLS